MKKVLILSYYLPPYTGIEGHRPNSWKNEFYRHGLFPVVITRQWAAGMQKSWSDYVSEFGEGLEVERTDFYEVIRLPHKHGSMYTRLNRTIFSSGYYWLQKALGRFHVETDAFTSFLNYVSAWVRENNPHAIVISSPPLNLIELGYKLAVKFDIPLIVDFRDLHNNHLLKTDHNFSMTEKTELFLFEKYLRKWLKKAVLVSAVSSAVIEKIPAPSSTKKIVIKNGFEKNVFEAVAGAEASKDKFIISILGNLYMEQDLDFMIEGFNAFIRTVEKEKVLIQFIGLNGQREIADKIRKSAIAENVMITDRMKREAALSLVAKSQILYHMGWEGYKGIYSGKLFEYLGSKRNILVAPSDKDVMEELLRETNAGKVANNVSEMADVLKGWFHEWEKKGSLAYHGQAEKIEAYTRESQAARLASAILEVTNAS